MRLNKIRLYKPTSSSGGGSIVDAPYNRYTWDGDTTQGASRNSIRDKIESMGYSSGKVLYVDATYGDDSVAQKGNILKPFLSLNTASAYANSGDLMVVFPGNFTLGAFGLPLKDGVDYYMLNPTFDNYDFSYGLIMVYPYQVSCKIFGKATFTDHAPVGGWAMITPYLDCNIEFEGMTFVSNKLMIGQLGAIGSSKYLKFKNCSLVSNDNGQAFNTGGGFTVGSAFFEDCYMRGNFLVSNGGVHPSYGYKLKFSRCEMEANPTNANGDTCFLRLVDFYGSTETSKVFIDHCVLRSSTHNIEIGDGYGGIGTNKSLIIKDSYFFNANAGGWIKNEHANASFKLVNNWSQNIPSGSVIVTNLLTGTGFTYDTNLE